MNYEEAKLFNTTEIQAVVNKIIVNTRRQVIFDIYESLNEKAELIIKA
ncbi:MAG: hypothetical protein PHP92_05735 [Candidatus Nanoarchaeia archaeon]|nr:hypothetical protein [Candidatus Nanoarchaeia archaeon]